MQDASLLPRYWYLWLTVFLLVAAAITGDFKESIYLRLDSMQPGMKLWQFILGMGVFVALTGLMHRQLDRSAKPFPRWLKIAHLSVTPLFCLSAFVYILMANAKRQADPRRYFSFNDFRYQEELNGGMVGFVLLFVVVQVAFFGYLAWRFFRRRLIQK